MRLVRRAHTSGARALSAHARRFGSCGDVLFKILIGKTQREGAQTVLFCACSPKAVPGA